MRNASMMIRSRETPISVAVVGIPCDGNGFRGRTCAVDHDGLAVPAPGAAPMITRADVGDRRPEHVELSLGCTQDDRLLGVAAAVALEDLRQHEVDELLQHERHADGGDEEGQRPRVAPTQWPVRDGLN